MIDKKIKKAVDACNKKYDGAFYIHLGELDGKLVGRIDQTFSHTKMLETPKDVEKLVTITQKFRNKVAEVSEEILEGEA